MKKSKSDKENEKRITWKFCCDLRSDWRSLFIEKKLVYMNKHTRLFDNYRNWQSNGKNMGEILRVEV